MKAKWTNLFWGLILIAAGGLFLAQNLGYLGKLKSQVWMIIFGFASLFFFVTYFVNGIRSWGWLFPAFIFAALALTVWMANQDIEGSVMGVPVLVAVGLPFLLAFALSPRRNWWALILVWVMTVVVLIVLMAGRAQGEWIAALVLSSIGLPFLLVFIINRQHWWALIPAWIMLVIVMIVLLSNLVAGEWIAAVVLMGIALPFFFVFFRNRQHWWALLPAGILTSLAGTVLLAGLFGNQENALSKTSVLNSILFLGIALTFLLIWLQRATQPTSWAIYVAGTSVIVALVSLLFGASQIAFPILIIAIGLLVLFFAFKPKKAI